MTNNTEKKNSDKTGLMLELSLSGIHFSDYEKQAIQQLWKDSLTAEWQGDLPLALQLHKEILSKGATCYSTYLRAATLHYQTKDYPEALIFFEKATALSFEQTTPIQGSINCHLSLGNTEQAILLIKELNTVSHKKIKTRSLGCNYKLKSSTRLNAFTFPESMTLVSSRTKSFRHSNSRPIAKKNNKAVL